MAKKGLAVQLQIEVNNDDDWNNLLQKNGLIVVDVYSEWCGPCVGMVATLKKIKLEMGGDILHLAIAKAEGVTALSRFRGKSEPTWMLIAKGKLVNFMFGANAPKLTQMIVDELKKEMEAMEGRRERVLYDIEEPTPLEKKRLAKIEAEKRAEEERERQKIEQEVRERRTKECNGILENLSHYGVILVLPNATKRYQEIINDLLSEAGLNITKTEKTFINAEKLEELFYFDENRFNEQTIDEILNNESICLIVKPKHSQDLSEEIEDILLKLVYGNSKAPPGDPNSPAMILARPPLPVKLLQSLIQIQPQRLSDDDDDGDRDEEEEGEENEEEMGESDELPKEPNTFVPNYLTETKGEEEEEEDAVEEEEEAEKISLWTPSNAMVKASALKLFATDIVSNYILPIPEPTPPHFALVFDGVRRYEVFSLMEKYRKQVLNYGFFTDSVPEKAELIAKTFKQYERTPAKPADAKMVIQLSRKKSECFLAFITLKPNYISPNSDEGKRECKIFFPDEYDVKKEEEAEEEEDVIDEGADYLEGDEELMEEFSVEEEVEEETDEEEDEDDDEEEEDEADFYEVIEGYVA